MCLALTNIFVMLSHGGSVISNLFANYRSYDKNENLLYKVGEILLFCH